MAGPLISFLTDFGGESAPATCRGVMWRICPNARLLDLSHQVRKFAVRDGAFLLSRAVGYLEVGVHLAVVDPGVGTARRPIAVRTHRGDLLVGPDNGLLRPAAIVLGGIDEARHLTASDLFLPTVSDTFHGRDLFAPVAAHLAAGVPFEHVGPVVDAADLVDLRLPDAAIRDGGLDTAVLFIDSFGNARLAGHPVDLARLDPATSAAPGPTSGQRYRVRGAGFPADGLVVAWRSTFGDAEPGEPLLYDDADYDGLAIAIDQGSAADTFGLAVDQPIRIDRAS
jgi:S-adenosylmethionine hydrolase